MKSLLTCLLWLTAVDSLHAEPPWNKSLQEKYRSASEGAEVTFGVRCPPKVDRLETYPLVVVLNGGPRVQPSDKYPFFSVRPTRNAIWGYRTISAYDAMQVVALMKNKYPIDPNRIYLVGSSAGGSGAMHLASCFPDEFAAVLPLIAAGNNYPLRNFSNLPVAFHHGDRDWVSAICNARVQTQRLQQLGCPTILQEYAGAGHGVPGSHEPLMAWLFKQRRDPAPRVIRHDCETPSLGRCYWLQIEEFDDPHRRASINAEIENGVATLRLKNVAAFSLDLDLISDVKTVRIGNTRLTPSQHYRLREGRWQTAGKSEKPAGRVYEAGAAANLYQGQPLLIVYGTNSKHTEQLRAAAQKLATYGGPTHTTLRRHRFQVVADQDLTAAQQARCNLILIGTPQQNRITGTAWDRLPVALKEKSLVVAKRLPLKLHNQVLGLLYPNPDHPTRLLYIVAPFADAAGMKRFSKQIPYLLPGSDGFDRVSQPDLVVQDLNYRVARQMQFNKRWQWLELPGADTPIPPRYADRSNMAITCMQHMLSKSQADFALWWGPADRGMWGADFNHLLSFDSASYTLADFRTRHRVCETTLGSVRGAELKEIWKRWGLKRELLCVPKIALDQLDDEANYRLHIPMDMYIKLGQRRKNLGDPKAGPAFAAEELTHRVFGRD